jgi:hypothetical protein
VGVFLYPTLALKWRNVKRLERSDSGRLFHSFTCDLLNGVNWRLCDSAILDSNNCATLLSFWPDEASQMIVLPMIENDVVWFLLEQGNVIFVFTIIKYGLSQFLAQLGLCLLNKIFQIVLPGVAP